MIMPDDGADPDASPTSVTSREQSHRRVIAAEQLLFGIIAFQTNFITHDVLVAAFHAWVQNKSRSLAHILTAQAALAEEEVAALNCLIQRFVSRHGGDPEKSLASLSPVPQAGLELQKLADSDLTATVSQVGLNSRNPYPIDPETTIPFHLFGGPERFRILRPHATGGLGQVSVALDQDLHREVAYKELLPKHAADPISRERFLREAEVTGGLEHPGIVPVYALGQAPDGRPFYVMRFVKGDSLKTAIETFHRVDNPNRKDPGARQLALRILLGRFIDVCNAMEYAHSRGVLHRDLKPGNIMVGSYGETLVVDWGLAKVLGKGSIELEESTLKPVSELSSSAETQPGQAIGTPAYMSPEQAAGRLDDIGPASDVYGLGATLYHLLSGRPAFTKDAMANIVARIQRGDFPRPRKLVPEIPRPLEAICLKAMALEAVDRYATPRLLADDLQNWLADEPVIAAPQSVVGRIARITRRHWRAVIMTGVALAPLLGVFYVQTSDQSQFEKVVNTGLMFSFTVGALAVVLCVYLAIDKAGRSLRQRRERLIPTKPRK